MLTASGHSPRRLPNAITMTYRRLFAVFLCALVLSGCARLATVTERKSPSAALARKVGGPTAALEAYLASVERASQKLAANPADATARREYNEGVARICGTLRNAKLSPWTTPIRTGKYTLAYMLDPSPDWHPSRFEMIPVDLLDIKGKYVEERETKQGLGAPMVARRIADPSREYSPTPHLYYAATAVVRFEGTRGVLSFVNPLESETVRVGKNAYPLAADYTAPLAMMLVEMHPKELGLPRLLHPEKFAATTRISRLEPFDPNKTVVLFIHGLMDSPATWFPLINHLRADEEIRRNYQFWFYSYPSGYPYAYSAAVLRRELDHAEKAYPQRKKMVVIGHSMGGCISRLLVTDTERKLWDEMFTVPPEKMDIIPEHKHILTESSIFAHRPEIGRVIYISAPLRGSELASDWVGRIGSKLVQVPSTLLTLGKEDARYEKHRTGELHLKHYPDSVDTLAPNNRFVLAINSIPVTKRIPHHVISGDRGKGGNKDETKPVMSDGVVPYWSSHMDTAESELVVPSHHSAHRNATAIAEVRRILDLHAAETGR